ncbi:MAG: ribosome-associated translation inhibitor RaiA [Candidatus Omnitrophica bacterium]|nr:ribosome-associated translation inhibitor RaiA [Candidatus Omnitrophota bacterium]
MEIDISGRHFHVTEPLKQYAAEKLGKFDKAGLKIEAIHVVFDVQKFMHIAEIVVRGKELRVTAKEQSTDAYAAFDKCFANVQLQLRRTHDRVKDHRKKAI